MIKGAIFDMDGTLLDSMPIWMNASTRYLKRLGIQAETNLAEILFHMSMQEGAEYIRQTYQVAEDTDAIIAGVNAIVYEAYEKEVQPKAGVRDFLEGLKLAGIPMVVATSSDREMAEAAFARTGLMPYFHEIFTCSEVGAGKSSPDIYFAAAKALGTKIEETWTFEDALYATKTAKAAGFCTVGLYDASSDKEQAELREIADIYVDDLTDFKGIFEKMMQMP